MLQRTSRMLRSSFVSARARASVVSLFVALAALFVALPAAAVPTLTLSTGGTNPSRSGVTRDQAHRPNAISYQDCIDNITMTFTLIAAPGTFVTGSDTVQVWAGVGDCTQTTNRAAMSLGTCQPVSDTVGVGAAFSVSVTARDLVYASLGKQSPGNGGLVTPLTHQTDPSICSQRTDPAGAPMNVAFLDFAAGAMGNDAAGSVVYTAAMGSNLDITVDTVGPPLPTGPSISIGSELLKLSWTPVDNATDTFGFTVFCDPAPGKDPAVAPGLPDGAAVATCDASATTTDSAVPTDSATTVDAVASDAADSAVTPTDSGSGCSTSGDGGGGCYSAVIKQGINGTLIDRYYVCASIADKTSTQATITGLTNDKQYTFGVAASDLVGNVGPVLVFDCATPQAIDDFWNRYKNAGGGAGGTFCALEAVGLPVTTSMMGLACVVVALALVRRRRR